MSSPVAFCYVAICLSFRNIMGLLRREKAPRKDECVMRSLHYVREDSVREALSNIKNPAIR